MRVSPLPPGSKATPPRDYSTRNSVAATDTPGQERVKRRQCDAGNTISSFSNVSCRTGQAATAWTVQLAQHLARPDPSLFFWGDRPLRGLNSLKSPKPWDFPSGSVAKRPCSPWRGRGPVQSPLRELASECHNLEFACRNLEDSAAKTQDPTCRKEDPCRQTNIKTKRTLSLSLQPASSGCFLTPLKGVAGKVSGEPGLCVSPWGPPHTWLQFCLRSQLPACAAANHSLQQRGQQPPAAGPAGEESRGLRQGQRGSWVPQEGLGLPGWTTSPGLLCTAAEKLLEQRSPACGGQERDNKFKAT